MEGWQMRLRSQPCLPNVRYPVVLYCTLSRRAVRFGMDIRVLHGTGSEFMRQVRLEVSTISTPPRIPPRPLSSRSFHCDQKQASP
jgi:hypothetical protein